MASTKLLSWKCSMSVWWSFIWRSAVYGAVGGIVLGAIGGFIAGATGHLDEARIYGGIAGYLAGVTLSTLAMKQALQGNLARLVAASQAPDY
jgi:hypothetical protein